MAYTPLKISIAAPCHEDWNGMHPVAGTTARHCDSCAKNVVDFTGFTDAQMHAYVRLNDGKMCGRFRPDQLDRPLRAVSKPGYNPLKVAATAAGLMLAASGCDTLSAPHQTNNETVEARELEGLVPEPPRSGEISIEEIEQPEYTPAESLAVTAVPGEVSVVPPPPEEVEDILMGDLSFEEVDSSGVAPVESNGSATAPPLPPPPPPKVGMITIAGQDTSHVLVGNTASVQQKGTLTPADTISPDTIPHDLQPMIMGMMIVQQPEPRGIDWVKDTLRKATAPEVSAPSSSTAHPRSRPDDLPRYLENLTVYPNPFVSELIVAVELPRPQRMVVELVSPNGRRIHTETFEGVAGTNNFVVEPKRSKLAHAAYRLRVSDAEGRMVTRMVVR